MSKKQEKSKTEIDVDLLGHEYVISVETNGYTLHKKGDKSNVFMGYYGPLDLATPLKKIARDFMSHTGEKYDLQSYLRKYNSTLKSIEELVKH